MIHRPSVSVVVPTRDRPQLVRRAIRDIVAQTYEGHIEVIVVFDRSKPDQSLAYGSHNRSVRVMKNQRTPGLAGGRNTGVLSATGDLIAFCDDDDEWMPGKLEAQVRVLEASDEVALVASGIYVKRGDKVTLRLPDETKLRYEDFLEDRIMEVNPCTMLVDRVLLVDKIGLVDERIPGSYAEDYELLLRAVQHATFKIVPEPLTVIHWGVGSFFAERWQTIYDAIDYLIDKHPDLTKSPVGLARLRGQQAVALAGTGQRKRALAMAMETRRLNPKERRWIVAALGAVGVVPVSVSVKLANRMGRGI